MSWLCKIFGHKVVHEDLAGGTLFEVCSRCPWVGRCLEDAFADEHMPIWVLMINSFEGQKMEERDTELGKKERYIHKNWFNHQDAEKQAEIIKPAFEKEFPTNEKKREAAKKYGPKE